ncbi:MAG: alpha/beta fold hydrolase, partial [Gemmatimonadaceae bacterium]
ALRDALVAGNSVVVRFNFRGIGASEGSPGDGTAETADALGAVGFARERFADLPLSLLGWSFGASVAVRSAPEVADLAALVAIDSFSENVIQSVHEQSRALLGADIMAVRNEPRTPAVDSLVDSLRSVGIPSVVSTNFVSMALVPRSGGTRLVQVRAVSEGYPFYGKITSDPPAAWPNIQSGANAVVD